MNQKQTFKRNHQVTNFKGTCTDNRMCKSEQMSKTDFDLQSFPEYSETFFIDICPSWVSTLFSFYIWHITS